MNDKLSSKAKFLYEGNNNSPLFLKTADFYLGNNEVQIAIQIIEAGLKIFPDHPLAFILMGKANHLLGNIDAAEYFIKRASELLNSSRTYSHYKNLLKLPDKTVSPFDSSRGSVFINSSVEQEDNFKTDKSIDVEINSVDERLSQIAEQMINARIERSENITVPEKVQDMYLPDKSKLATETLAKIYLSQGEKGEAIKIFELLINRNPEKKEYYLGKIAEIRAQ